MNITTGRAKQSPGVPGSPGSGLVANAKFRSSDQKIAAMKESQHILIKYHDYLKKLYPVIEKFPRSYRFILGDRILVLSFDLLERLIEAYYQKEKIHLLTQANITAEKIRNFLRLAADLQLLSLKHMENLLTLLDETGRMLGGWLKKEKSKDENL